MKGLGRSLLVLGLLEIMIGIYGGLLLITIVVASNLCLVDQLKTNKKC